MSDVVAQVIVSEIGGDMRRFPTVAVAASMLTATDHMSRDGVESRELGPDHFERRDRPKAAARLLHPLAEFGLKVPITAGA